jgi:hypothetical protein
MDDNEKTAAALKAAHEAIVATLKSDEFDKLLASELFGKAATMLMIAIAGAGAIIGPGPDDRH